MSFIVTVQMENLKTPATKHYFQETLDFSDQVRPRLELDRARHTASFGSMDLALFHGRGELEIWGVMPLVLVLNAMEMDPEIP